jgi:hypothetical protein
MDLNRHYQIVALIQPVLSELLIDRLVSLETLRDGTSSPIEDDGTRDLTDIIRAGPRRTLLEDLRYW